MSTSEIFDKASKEKFIIIDNEELEAILKDAEILREENTQLSDYVRLLKYDSKLFIQETSLTNEIIIRKISSMQDAELFIKERLDFYERKWDGCGCKIDYYG